MDERNAAISFANQRSILKELAGTKYAEFFWFCCCTGMRVCEALSIKGSDIHDDHIRIRMADTKTKKHRRNVPYIPELLDGFVIKKTKLLFDDITDEGSKQFFSRLYNNLNLDFSRHSTRHTFVSICGYVGIPPEQIQAWVGHTDIKMTRDTYTHLLEKGSSPVLDYVRKLKKVFSLPENLSP